MSENLRLSLITVGDPTRLTGGFLYHHRVRQKAPLMRGEIEVLSLPDLRFPLPILGLPRILWSLYRSPPDVVLLDSLAAAFVAPALPLVAQHTPILAMVHQVPGGIDHGPLRRAIQHRLDNLAYQACSGMILCSESLKETFHQLGYQNLHVVEPGCDLPAITQDTGVRDLKAGRRLALLCVANWSPVKDILSLLRAVEQLTDDAATLHLIGRRNLNTEYGQKVQRTIAGERLAHRVVVHGEVPPEQLTAFYRDSDLFVMTSLGETYGMVYGEALNAGLPIVGWRLGHLPNLVEHDQQGWLVDPGDLVQLRDSIEMLGQDESRRLRLSQGAASKARQLPTWEDTTRRVMEVARTLVRR
jgi:glycosyltransferase involved in cell wall biosynthesis